MQNKKWARLSVFVTGLVNQTLLLQSEYLAAENRILRSRLPGRLRLSAPERSTLAEIGKRLGRRGLEQVACVTKPDTTLAGSGHLLRPVLHPTGDPACKPSSGENGSDLASGIMSLACQLQFWSGIVHQDSSGFRRR
jgi:hypothetical protein